MLLSTKLCNIKYCVQPYSANVLIFTQFTQGSNINPASSGFPPLDGCVLQGLQLYQVHFQYISLVGIIIGI